MEISNTTKSALYGAIGVLVSYYVARQVKAKHPIYYIVAGSLAAAVISQPGELKKLIS